MVLDKHNHHLKIKNIILTNNNNQPINYQNVNTKRIGLRMDNKLSSQEKSFLLSQIDR